MEELLVYVEQYAVIGFMFSVIINIVFGVIGIIPNFLLTAVNVLV
jgi:hypothetical protein